MAPPSGRGGWGGCLEVAEEVSAPARYRSWQRIVLWKEEQPSGSQITVQRLAS